MRREQNLRPHLNFETEHVLRGRGNTSGGACSRTTPPGGDPSPSTPNEIQNNAPFPNDTPITTGYYANEIFDIHRHNIGTDNPHTDEIHQNRGESSSRSVDTTQTIPGIDKVTKKRIMFITLLLSTVLSSIGAWIKYNEL